MGDQARGGGGGFNPLNLVGMGLGFIGGIGQLFGVRKSNRELEKLIGKDPKYAMNPIAQQRLGLMQTLLNARMPGAVAQERNIYGAQGSQIANINRVSTDASQALAMSAGAQGQTDKAFGELGQQEAGDYQRRLSNLVGAQEGMIAEGDKMYNDEVRRFGDLAQIKGAQQQNRQNAWGSLSNMGFGLANFGMAGGMEGMFGGGGGGGQAGRTGIVMGGQPMSRGSYANVGYGGTNFGYMPYRPITR